MLDNSERPASSGDVVAADSGPSDRARARRSWLTRMRASLPEHVLPTGGALVGNFLITGAFGFLFWLLAAHYFATADVGFAAAAVSAMMFLAVFASFGLGTLIIREAPNYQGREVTLVATGVVGVGILGAVVGLVFAVVIGEISLSFRFLLVPQNAAAFAFGVGLTTAMQVLDQCLVGLLNGRVLIARGLMFSVVKLAAVFVAGIWYGDHTGMLIFATWVLGDVVSIIVLGVFALRRGVARDWLPREWRLLRRLLPQAAGHQFLNIGLLAPGWATPVLVTVLLSPEANASFYVAGIITAPGLFVPAALAFSLFAIAVQNPGQLRHQIRTTLVLSFGAAVLAAIGVLLLGRLVLGLFGQSYVDEGTTPLILLTLGMFPISVKAHFANLRRIEGRTLSGSIYVLGGGGLELLGAAVGAILAGINGVALGMLLAMTVEAFVMLPTVIKAVRPPEFEDGQITAAA